MCCTDGPTVLRGKWRYEVAPHYSHETPRATYCRVKLLTSPLTRSNFSGPQRSGLACGPTTRGAPSRTVHLADVRRSALSSTRHANRRTSDPLRCRTRATFARGRDVGSRKWYCWWTSPRARVSPMGRLESNRNLLLRSVAFQLLWPVRRVRKNHQTPPTRNARQPILSPTHPQLNVSPSETNPQSPANPSGPNDPASPRPDHCQSYGQIVPQRLPHTHR